MARIALKVYQAKMALPDHFVQTRDLHHPIIRVLAKETTKRGLKTSLCHNYNLHVNKQEYGEMRKNWSGGVNEVAVCRYREQISTFLVCASSFKNSDEPANHEIELRDTNANGRRVSSLEYRGPSSMLHYT